MRSATPAGALDGARDDLVLYFSGSWWNGPPGHDRSMAQALSRYRPVLFVGPPISALTRFNHPHLVANVAAEPILQVLGPRLARLNPRAVPGMTRPGLHRLVAPALRWAARDAVDRLYPARPADHRRPVAAVVSSRLERLWPAVPARRRLYYATDDLVAGADMLGVPRGRLVRDEARTLRGADAVAVVSTALQDLYAAAGHPAELVPNGCSPEAYLGVDRAPVPADAQLDGPVAGFVGQVNDRIDLSLLEAVADTGCTLLIVGPQMGLAEPRRFEALTARTNVRWVGRKPFAELPGYLRVIDVGLTPYADNAFNRASFPLKTLEYLAAGRAVVATPLPAHTWLGTDLVRLAAGPVEFAAQVRAAVSQPDSDSLRAVRRAFARQHSWDRRARLLAGLIGIDVTDPVPR